MKRSRARILSNIGTDIAQVFFAISMGSLALPLDADKAMVVLFYLVLSLLFWFLAIIYGEKGRV